MSSNTRKWITRVWTSSHCEYVREMKEKKEGVKEGDEGTREKREEIEWLAEERREERDIQSP